MQSLARSERHRLRIARRGARTVAFGSLSENAQIRLIHVSMVVTLSGYTRSSSRHTQSTHISARIFSCTLAFLRSTIAVGRSCATAMAIKRCTCAGFLKCGCISGRVTSSSSSTLSAGAASMRVAAHKTQDRYHDFLAKDPNLGPVKCRPFPTVAEKTWEKSTGIAFFTPSSSKHISPPLFALVRCAGWGPRGRSPEPFPRSCWPSRGHSTAGTW